MLKFDSTKFDPVVRPPDRAPGATVIDLLAAAVFCFGGIVAFAFDHVTLLGRTSTAEFSDGKAHFAGALCFLITAFWIAKYLKAYRASWLLLISPFIVAILTSGVLLLLKRQ